MDIALWDAAAAEFDREPDHGLGDPGVRAAWARRLRGWLPVAPASLADLGCGTGSLALLAAEGGYRVTAVDASPAMVDRARAKLAGTPAHVLVGDAAHPPLAAGRFDAVLVRHVLWTLPEPEAVLRRWARLLRPGGRLVLVEGRWGTSEPAGITASRLAETVERAVPGARLSLADLTGEPALWGGPVHDERYALVAELPREAARARWLTDVHVLLRRGDRVLLTRRARTGYADGMWHLPSGHVEDTDPDVRAAASREAAEETGVRVDPSGLRCVLTMQHRAPGQPPRTGWFFEAAEGSWEGEARITEPEKCDGQGWFRLDGLGEVPGPLVSYCREALEAYRRGDRFLAHLHDEGDPIGWTKAAAPHPNRARPL